MPCKPLYCVFGKLVIPQRYVLCFMTFFAVLISYTMRTCLHIAITEMVVPPPATNSTSKGEVCPGHEDSVNVTGGTFNWTERQKGLILSAFFPGYVISHLPGGFMADKFGAKHIISGGIAISGLFTILTPLAVRIGGWWLLVIIRFIIGFSQGPLYPCMSTLLAKWVPLRERTGLGAFVNTGNQLGSIAGNLITSLLMAYVNWPMVFYFWGIAALIWYVIFLFTCYSEPSQHPFITPEEAEMLRQELGTSERMKVPWKRILIDPITWGLMGGQVAHDLIFFLIVVQLPTYMKEVLKFNIKSNGVLNSIPYLCLWICSVGSGVFADYVISKKWTSVLFMRQLYTFVGNVGPGAFVLVASYLGCQRIASAAMFILGMFIMGPFYAGMKVNVLDITRNFAGIIMAIVNGLGALAFVPVPYVTALLTPDKLNITAAVKNVKRRRMMVLPLIKKMKMKIWNIFLLTNIELLALKYNLPLNIMCDTDKDLANYKIEPQKWLLIESVIKILNSRGLYNILLNFDEITPIIVMYLILTQ